MSPKKGSLLNRFRNKKAHDDVEVSNLGKIETMPQEDEDTEKEMFEEEEEVLVDEDTEEEEENVEVETAPDLEDDEEEGATEEASEEADELSSEYEGQLTIDVFQTDKEIIIVSTIAGVEPGNIDVSIDNDMVTIKGERKNDFEISEDDYYYQECYWGAFSRSVILPVDVISDRALADLKNGILTIKLPKAKQSRTKKISVKAG
ncbi:Hsp20/alpha crystallin family protein [Patescibacteria group bacterium]|nr:Hsp20/alpha crystallin family protein [Patescibacteria group bacterium]